MALRLAIENAANLPDGGPLDMTITGRRGIDIGRDQHLDWSLPDPSRVVSSKHCEVRYREGGYWLTDVSTNGTFLNGSPFRMQAPHRLANGDRIEIGQYIIGVHLDGEEGAAAEPAPSAMPMARPGDMWGGVAPPMEITPQRPEASQPFGQADALDWFADLPVPEIPAPVSLPRADDAWIKAGASAPPPMVAPPVSAPAAWDTPPALPSQAQSPFDLRPATPDLASFAREVPLAEAHSTTAPSVVEAAAHPAGAQDVTHAAEVLSAPSAPALPTPVAAPAPPKPFERVARTAPQDAADLSSERFIELVAHGAGMPVEVFRQQPPEKVAEIIGGVLRATVDELRSFLQARAETKGLVRSTNQTMIQAFENNPMKFSPSSDEAMRKMLAIDNRSYLPAIEAVQQSFRDLKTHQINTYGAMQQALKMIIEDFEPTMIERVTEQESGLGGMMSNRKAKLWEAFVTKWKAKAGRHDNGLVDVFMIYFAECYDRLTSKLR